MLGSAEPLEFGGEKLRLQATAAGAHANVSEDPRLVSLVHDANGVGAGRRPRSGSADELPRAVAPMGLQRIHEGAGFDETNRVVSQWRSSEGIGDCDVDGGLDSSVTRFRTEATPGGGEDGEEEANASGHASRHHHAPSRKCPSNA